MPNFTAKAIKATFLELLEQCPLSEITVKDIVETCGINRNSFYYHYQDLPALIEEIIREEADAVIRKYPSVGSIVECYLIAAVLFPITSAMPWRERWRSSWAPALASSSTG